MEHFLNTTTPVWYAVRILAAALFFATIYVGLNWSKLYDRWQLRKNKPESQNDDVPTTSDPNRWFKVQKFLCHTLVYSPIVFALVSGVYCIWKESHHNDQRNYYHRQNMNDDVPVTIPYP